MIDVIGAGFGRTGTASLKVALERLGLGPCYHMSEVLADPGNIDFWMAAADGRPDWESTFRGYRSCVDFPACGFYAELAAAYPDAKVILTVRDAGSWFESVNETIMSPALSTHLETSPFGEMVRRTVTARFDHRVEDRAHMIECFNRHIQAVRSTIPKERLLEYEVKQGWGPLCAFLGLDAPAEAFPHVNSREETKALFARMMDAEMGSSNEQMKDLAGELFDEGEGA